MTQNTEVENQINIYDSGNVLDLMTDEELDSLLINKNQKKDLLNMTFVLIDQITISHRKYRSMI